MKILQNDNHIHIDNKVNEFEYLLKTNKIVILNSYDPVEHIAAYVAWNTIGGNIFIKHPTVPIEQSEYLNREIEKIDTHNSVLFHTSGTTGFPKIIINTHRHFEQSSKMATNALHWNNDTRFLNFLPAFTSGFWHMITPVFVNNPKSTIFLGSRNSIVQDLSLKSNLTILVPSLLDQLKIRDVPLNFSKFERVGSGASAPQERHARLVFENRGNRFNTMYGATEICTPILSRLSTHIDDHPTYMNFKNNGDGEIKLENNELWVKGPSVCENYTGWHKTGDIFEQKDDMILHVGRSNELVKINGFTTSLPFIETTTEDRLELGETRAVVKNRAGSDFIELEYTNPNAIINKTEFNIILQTILPRSCIPVKYTYVESIPKNALGKKLRYANS